MMSAPNNDYPRQALSPVSSEWSGISRYQSFQSVSDAGGPPPNIPPPRNGPTPVGGRRPSVASTRMGEPRMNPMSPMSPMDRGMEGMNGAPSPPASVARSSDTTGLYSPDGNTNAASLQGIIFEEQVASRHATLQRLLGDALNDQPPGWPHEKTNAQEKLIKLSSSQFAELSEDIHDELCRREGLRDRSEDPNSPIPLYLPAKPEFYYKRNQARMRLHKLPMKRFRTLASDIFFELERRYPKLCGAKSPTNSMHNGQFPPQRITSPGPPRVGSPGPGRVNSPGPGGMRNGPPGGPGYGNPNVPRLGNPPPPPGMRMSPGPPGSPAFGPPGPNGNPNTLGRPLPRTYQNQTTIVPNISTMVEEDDDGDDASGYEGMSAYDRASDRDSKISGPSVRPDSMRSRKSIKESPTETDKKAVAEYETQISDLQKKIEDLEKALKEKEEKMAQAEDDERKRETENDSEKKEWQDMRLNLEEKLIDAENLNSSLQSEIARLKADNAAMQREVEQQLKEQKEKHSEALRKVREEHEEELRARGPAGAGAMNDAELAAENERLQKELQEQEEVTEEVRREATAFLEQMRELTQSSEQAWEREEALHKKIDKLEEEVKEWKAKYARVKSQLRTIRAASMGLPLGPAAQTLGKDGSFKDPNGLVKDIYVTKYQIAVDDLLRLARTAEASKVLDFVKNVIVATKAITQDIDDSSPSSDPNAEQKMRLKVRVSATANSLITAAKNHATAEGLSPVSLLDAAAMHLTASIVELIKLVKIRPTPTEEIEKDAFEEEQGESDQNFDSSQFPDPPTMSSTTSNGIQININGPNEQARMSQDSVYSATPSSPPRSNNIDEEELVVSPPNWGKRRPERGGTIGSASILGPDGKLPAFSIRTSTSNVEELRAFVELEFEGIVESIQSLLSVIRSDAEVPVIQKQIDDIATVVGKVLASTEQSMQQTGNMALRDRGDWIVKNLGDCRLKMLAMAEEDASENLATKAEIKEFKRVLAGLAFEMAREIKELVRTIEDIDNETRSPVVTLDDDDSFR